MSGMDRTFVKRGRGRGSPVGNKLRHRDFLRLSASQIDYLWGSMAAAAGRRTGVQSGYCHQMLMECRTNRYNNPYMVRLPAAAAGAVGLGERGLGFQNCWTLTLKLKEGKNRPESAGRRKCATGIVREAKHLSIRCRRWRESSIFDQVARQRSDRWSWRLQVGEIRS